MRIVLENKLEKQVWEIMMAAHSKWERNYGDLIREHMDWYFKDLYKKEVKAIVEKEARRRVNGKWELVLSLETTLEEYLEECADDGVPREELVEEYEHLRGQMLKNLEDEKVAVEENLRKLYSSFFNAPERLTVVYEEIIQGEKFRV